MAIPQNAQQIYQLLTAAGLSANAAAGILGNIEQESGGNTQAGSYPGSYGLIQWTPANQSTYTVPDNSSVATQVGYIIDYIKANGSISAINAASTSPTAAAIYFQNEYEKPAPAAENQENRTSSAVAVADAASSGNWTTGAAPSGGTTAGATAGDITDITGSVSEVAGLIKDISEVLNSIFQWFHPGQQARVMMGAGGLISGTLAVKMYAGGGSKTSQYPLIILLTGITVLCAFMAFRPWPQSSTGKSYRVAPYVTELLGGKVPSGPSPSNDTSQIETGVTALITIWAVSKAANAAGSIGGAFAGIGNFIAQLGKGAEDAPAGE